MTDFSWRWPNPKPLAYISPTVAADLETCSLRVGFARDPAFSSLRRIGDAAAVGIVAHAVYERVAKGEYDFPDGEDVVVVFQGIWDEELVRVEHRLEAAWKPARVPEPGEWRNIAKARRSLLRSQGPRLSAGHEWVATASSGNARHGRQGEASAATPLPWIERRLRDATLGIEGTPDRVERQADGVWILDLKSGWDQDEATDLQQGQLLIYAHLVGITLGERPTYVAIDSRKGRFPILVDWSRVEAGVHHVAQLRSDFNATLKEVDLRLAASPSEESCRFCSFRLVCEPSQTTVVEEWNLPLVVTGIVEAVHQDQSRLAVDVLVVYPAWRAGVQARIVDVAWSTSVRVGDQVSVAGVGSTSDGRTFFGAWDTLNYILNER